MIARIITALIGIWLMVAPDILDYGGAARINERIVGPLIAASAIIAATEATRPVRWAGIPLGAWLLLAPWVLAYPDTLTRIGSMVAGVVVILLTLVRGHVHGRFGGGWSSLWSTKATGVGRSPNDQFEHGR